MESAALHPLSESRIEASIRAVAARDADVAREVSRIGFPPARVRARGFATLCRAIVSQQLSVKAAASISERLVALLDGELSAERIRASSPEALRSAGLSARKVEYVQSLAEAVTSGRLSFTQLAEQNDEEAIATLSGLRGLGRWTAEIYLLSAEGRADIWPANDLALIKGVQRLRGWQEAPSAKAVRENIEPWRPQRSAMALFIWKLYGSATLDNQP